MCSKIDEKRRGTKSFGFNGVGNFSKLSSASEVIKNERDFTSKKGDMEIKEKTGFSGSVLLTNHVIDFNKTKRLSPVMRTIDFAVVCTKMLKYHRQQPSKARFFRSFHLNLHMLLLLLVISFDVVFFSFLHTLFCCFSFHIKSRVSCIESRPNWKTIYR